MSSADSMWHTASADARAEQAERRFALAKVAAAEVWPFLAKAETPAQYLARAGAVEDRLRGLVTAAVGQGYADLTLSEVKASLEQDWDTLATARAEQRALAAVQAALVTQAAYVPACGNTEPHDEHTFRGKNSHARYTCLGFDGRGPKESSLRAEAEFDGNCSVCRDPLVKHDGRLVHAPGFGDHGHEPKKAALVTEAAGVHFVKEYARDGHNIDDFDGLPRAYDDLDRAKAARQRLEDEDKEAGTHYEGRWRIISVTPKKRSSLDDAGSRHPFGREAAGEGVTSGLQTQAFPMGPGNQAWLDAQKEKAQQAQQLAQDYINHPPPKVPFHEHIKHLLKGEQELPSNYDAQGNRMPDKPKVPATASVHTAEEHGGYHLEQGDGGWFVVNHIGERKNSEPMSHDKALDYQRALMVNVPGAKDSADSHEEHGDQAKHSGLQTEAWNPFKRKPDPMWVEHPRMTEDEFERGRPRGEDLSNHPAVKNPQSAYDYGMSHGWNRKERDWESDRYKGWSAAQKQDYDDGYDSGASSRDDYARTEKYGPRTSGLQTEAWKPRWLMDDTERAADDHRLEQATLEHIDRNVQRAEDTEVREENKRRHAYHPLQHHEWEHPDVVDDEEDLEGEEPHYHYLDVHDYRDRTHASRKTAMDFEVKPHDNGKFWVVNSNGQMESEHDTEDDAEKERGHLYWKQDQGYYRPPYRIAAGLRVACRKCAAGHTPDGAACAYCDGAGSLDATTAAVKAADGWDQGLTAEAFQREAAAPSPYAGPTYNDGTPIDVNDVVEAPGLGRCHVTGVVPEHNGRPARVQVQTEEQWGADWEPGDSMPPTFAPSALKPIETVHQHFGPQPPRLPFAVPTTGAKQAVNTDANGSDRYQRTPSPARPRWLTDEWDEPLAGSLPSGQTSDNPIVPQAERPAGQHALEVQRMIRDGDEVGLGRETVRDLNGGHLPRGMAVRTAADAGDLGTAQHNAKDLDGALAIVTWTDPYRGVQTARGQVRTLDDELHVDDGWGKPHVVPMSALLNVQTLGFGGWRRDQDQYGKAASLSPGYRTVAAGGYGPGDNPFRAEGPGNPDTPFDGVADNGDPMQDVEDNATPVTTRPRVKPFETDPGVQVQENNSPQANPGGPGDPSSPYTNTPLQPSQPPAQQGTGDQQNRTTTTTSTLRAAEEAFLAPPTFAMRVAAKVEEIAAGLRATNPGMDQDAAVKVAADTLRRYPRMVPVQHVARDGAAPTPVPDMERALNDYLQRYRQKRLLDVQRQTAPQTTEQENAPA